MKRLHYIISFTFLFCLSCSYDKLKSSELIGLWEIESRQLVNHNSNNKLCCEYLEFFSDSNTKDLKGKYSLFNKKKEASGVFQVSSSNQFIDFQLKNSTMKYEFLIDQTENSLSLQYVKNDSIFYERWIKLN